MMQKKWLGRLAAIALLTAACSQPDTAATNDKMTVQGTVAQELYGADVEAVAIGRDGRSFWSALDAKGDFKLVVPTGQPYRVVLVRRGAQGRTPIIAELALDGALGRTPWLRGSGSVVRLGNIVPADAAGTATTVGAVKTASLHPLESGSGRGGDGTSADHDDDDDNSGSGRGGSGRGGSDDGTDDDDGDDYEDDQEHEDDPECREGDASKPVESTMCKAPATKTVVCTRGKDLGDYSEKAPPMAESVASCEGGGGGGTDAASSGSSSSSAGDAKTEDEHEDDDDGEDEDEDAGADDTISP